MPTKDTPESGTEWPRWLLRISLTLAAVLLFTQSITAGLFLAELHGAFPIHREMATAAGIALMFAVVAAILCVRLLRDMWWPIAATLSMLALMSLQAFAGFRSLTALHVPLGVVTIMLAIVLASWVWIRGVKPSAKTASRMAARSGTSLDLEA